MPLPHALVVLFAIMSNAALAHEFWIEPRAFMVENGAILQADFKNGEEFKGGNLSFFERTSDRFEVFAAGKLQRLTPRSGDLPALEMPAPAQDALVIAVHETTPSRLTYREWAKFLRFAKHKDFPTAAADHRARGWSETRFRERYTRHAKALIAVGNGGSGADRAFGMRTEFVALTNPYDANFNNNMKVRVLFDGKPRSNAQVEVFDRSAAGEVRITLHRTDANGLVTIPVSAGHSYLFDAVALLPAPEASTEEGALVWETYWAALTFAVPR